MPYFCLEKVTRALNSQEKAVKGSRVHLVGVAYKADVGDLRESPALKLIELLRDEGARGLVPRPPRARASRSRPYLGQTSTARSAKADCVAIVTAHSGIDYGELAEKAQLVVDFRNATGKNGSANGRVWKL